MLEHVAIRLDDVAVGPHHSGESGGGRPEHLGQPAPGALGPIDRAHLEPLQPAPILAEVVHQDLGLALEDHQAGPPFELAGVEAAGRDRDPEAEASAGARLELDLIDREAELVQAAHPGLDGVAVPRRQLDLGVELLPQLAVAALDALGFADRVVVVLAGRVVPPGEGGQVGQAEGNVLDEHLEVVLTLAIR